MVVFSLAPFVPQLPERFHGVRRVLRVVWGSNTFNSGFAEKYREVLASPRPTLLHGN